jgi:hypothetical protein
MARARRRATPVLAKRSASSRAFALCLAMTLALFLVVAAGHRHDSQADTRVCAVCAVLSSEMPGTDAMPAIVASTVTYAYMLLTVIAYVCWYRRPALMPPSCGPPCMPPRPEVAIFRFQF